MPGSTTTRGYGTKHQKLRARWARKLKQHRTIPCARCGLDITHGQPWDLGHSDDRSHYTGPEHINCNRSAGGRNGAKKTNAPKTILRQWG